VQSVLLVVVCIILRYNNGSESKHSVQATGLIACEHVCYWCGI